MIKKYKFYIDAGHGWLAVKRQELIDLNVIDKISSCSYQRGNTVYLEEDCDATRFMRSYEEINGFSPEYIEKICKVDLSPIRSYDHFQ